MPPDPLSRIAGRASPQYTVTFLLTVAFAFAGMCLICGVAASGVSRVLLVGGGLLFGAATLGSAIYTVFRRAELLRSEPHLRFLAIMAWSQDSTLDEEAARRREKMLPGLLDNVSKSHAHLPSTQESERNG